MSLDDHRGTADLPDSPRLLAERLVARITDILEAEGIDAQHAIECLEHFTQLLQQFTDFVDRGGDWTDARGRMYLDLLKGMSQARERAETERALDAERAQATPVEEDAVVRELDERLGGGSAAVDIAAETAVAQADVSHETAKLRRELDELELGPAYAAGPAAQFHPGALRDFWEGLRSEDTAIRAQLVELQDLAYEEFVPQEDIVARLRRALESISLADAIADMRALIQRPHPAPGTLAAGPLSDYYDTHITDGAVDRELHAALCTLQEIGMMHVLDEADLVERIEGEMPGARNLADAVRRVLAEL